MSATTDTSHYEILKLIFDLLKVSVANKKDVSRFIELLQVAVIGLETKCASDDMSNIFILLNPIKKNIEFLQGLFSM